MESRDIKPNEDTFSVISPLGRKVLFITGLKKNRSINVQSLKRESIFTELIYLSPLSALEGYYYSLFVGAHGFKGGELQNATITPYSILRTIQKI